VFLVANKDNLCKVYPSDNILTIELHRIPKEDKSLIAVYHCLGSRGSEAFSLALLRILREYLNVGGSYKSHQLGTVILTNRSLSIDELKKALTTLIQLHKKNLLKGIIIDELKKSSLFKRRVIEVAKKMGIIAKDSSIEEVRKVLSALLDMELIVDEAIRELLVENIDINVVEELLQKVVESKKVKIVMTKTASPFLQEISQLGSLRYIIRSSTLPRNEINIGEYLAEKCVEKNPFKCFISCPYCTSKALTVLENDNELQEFKDMLIKLKKRGFSKTDIGEYENMERASKVANLIMEYGLAALIALQGFSKVT
jgi:ATP-dependent Lhr-like helicase